MNLPLINSEDIEIVTQRECHFGSSFDLMLEYYSRGGIGVLEEIEISRIEELQKFELSSGKELSALLLGENEHNEIAASKEAYKLLKNSYKDDIFLPRALADMILSEEETPKEIETISKGAIEVPLGLLNNLDYRKKTFPGYGRAPILAVKALKKMKNPLAIPHLFNAIGNGDNLEQEVLEALPYFDKAKDLLIKKMVRLPISKDNTHAALALTYFPFSEDIYKAALSMKSNGILNEYLLSITMR